LALQYTIKLALAGYEDGRRIGTGRLSTTAVRIERLQEHIDAWNHLNWTPESRVIVPFTSALQLAGGVFATFSGETITFVELPSRIRGTPTHKWSYEVGFEPKDIGIDPSQDLLILVAMSVAESFRFFFSPVGALLISSVS
jgi:hypothetical protein